MDVKTDDGDLDGGPPATHAHSPRRDRSRKTRTDPEGDRGQQASFLTTAGLGLVSKASPNAIERLEAKLRQAGKPSLEAWLAEVLPGIAREDLTREQVASLMLALNHSYGQNDQR